MRSTTITLAFSIGTPSTCVDTAGALDYSVTVTIGTWEIEGEITLVPDHTGEPTSWGTLDHWMSGSLVALARALPDPAARDLTQALASCEDTEIDVVTLLTRDAEEDGRLDAEEVIAADNFRDTYRKLRPEGWACNAADAVIVNGVPPWAREEYTARYVAAARQAIEEEVSRLEAERG